MFPSRQFGRHLALAALTLGLLIVGLPASAQYGSDTADLPPGAKVGECYARVYVPATYRTTTEDVVSREPAERLEIIPAEYETVTEKIMVKPERTKLVKVPAKYEWEQEKVLVKDATTEWKKGPCDPKRQLANATGECLCLVETPARYKTVKRKVMVAPPATREVSIPAEYSTLKRLVEVRPPQERRIDIPSESTPVTRQVKVTDAAMKWQIIDCKFGGPLVDRATTMALQKALKAKGYDPGPIDGVFGSKTRSALQRFQRANNIDQEGVGTTTKRALGI